MSLRDGAAPTQERILAEVRAMMEREFGIDVGRVLPAAHLVEDLDLDSIDLVDFAASVEERLGLSFGAEELGSVRWVRDVVDLIHGALAERAGRE